jgi:tetratricopeptide (TPR) repeat protein
MTEYRKLLLDEYQASLSRKSFPDVSQIAIEADQHLNLRGDSILFESPIFAAVGILQENRKDFSTNTLPKNAVDLLERQKEKYSRYPGLYEFIRVNLYFGLGRFQQAADLTPPKLALPNPLLNISHQIVRAKAYERLKNYSQARKIWSELIEKIPDEDEKSLWRFRSAYLLNTINDRQLLSLGKADSEIQDPRLLRPVLMQLGSEEILLKIHKSTDYLPPVKTIADEALLLRYLFNKNYEAFLNVFQHAGSVSKKQFGVIDTAVRMLVKNSNDRKGLMNVGYFLQSLKMDPSVLQAPPKSSESMLGEFSDADLSGMGDVKQYDSPFQYYLNALKQFKPDEKDEVEAKSLYFISLCFKGSGNFCVWNDDRATIPLEQRKAWFKTLKMKYPNSAWAKQLKYYY